MAILLSLLLGFIPALFYAGLVYWLDRYEKEPKMLLGGVFIWGAIVASAAAFSFNTALGLGIYLFTHSESATDFTTSSLVAPVIEETLKGAAVLIVFLFARHEFDSLLDGIVYAAVVGLGFSATENFYYIYQVGYAENGIAGLLALAFVRVILVGWQHPFYTAFIGIGLAAARLSPFPNRRILWITLGWLTAVGTHSVHNLIAHYSSGVGDLLAATLVDWTGWLAMLGFIAYTIRREKDLITRFLGEEVAYGILTPRQYATACSPSARWRAQLFALGRRRFQITGRFYQLCGEIAHKKNQILTMGNEANNQAIIDQLRQELYRLSPYIPA